MNMCLSFITGYMFAFFYFRNLEASIGDLQRLSKAGFLKIGISAFFIYLIIIKLLLNPILFLVGFFIYKIIFVIKSINSLKKEVSIR